MMDDKDPKPFLRHILESAEYIDDYAGSLSKEEFLQSTQIQDSVMRRLEVIGEATKNLPQSFKETYPTIPWSYITGMRDVLIHDYFGVDLELVWATVKKDPPSFKMRIQEILKSLS